MDGLWSPKPESIRVHDGEYYYTLKVIQCQQASIGLAGENSFQYKRRYTAVLTSIVPGLDKSVLEYSTVLEYVVC
jgi:hypothetical protein